MSIKRREFIKSIGIGFASLILSQCSRFSFSDDPLRDDLRNCWLKLLWLEERTRMNMEEGENDRAGLLEDHRSALNRLVRRGDITSSIADQLLVAFGEATYHVWRFNSGMTCYIPMPGPDYKPTSSSQLATQAEILLDLAENRTIDLNTVAQAKACIERDIAFLNLSQGDVEALYDELVEAAGDTRNYPDFDNLELEVPSVSIEAAYFLIEVLLGIHHVVEE
jgi:hypothetical protein